ncbi:hypothetical protein C8Q70DRAFT_42411 [Cubamyces menziesii]|nr:hypothetical protein C8Q70DRAFT_42411 [Cubamyces menziesii]
MDEVSAQREYANRRPCSSRVPPASAHLPRHRRVGIEALPPRSGRTPCPPSVLFANILHPLLYSTEYEKKYERPHRELDPLSIIPMRCAAWKTGRSAAGRKSKVGRSIPPGRLTDRGHCKLLAKRPPRAHATLIRPISRVLSQSSEARCETGCAAKAVPDCKIPRGYEAQTGMSRRMYSYVQYEEYCRRRTTSSIRQVSRSRSRRNGELDISIRTCTAFPLTQPTVPSVLTICSLHRSPHRRSTIDKEGHLGRFLIAAMRLYGMTLYRLLTGRTVSTGHRPRLKPPSTGHRNGHVQRYLG